mmetsp:Transcript_57267/g.158544  ORF Transcript_57267/g.158544 Transcript_57267/m.158544 type:complete len:240 (-) Transcript_57267:188-907(-)
MAADARRLGPRPGGVLVEFCLLPHCADCAAGGLHCHVRPPHCQGLRQPQRAGQLAACLGVWGRPVELRALPADWLRCRIPGWPPRPGRRHDYEPCAHRGGHAQRGSPGDDGRVRAPVELARDHPIRRAPRARLGLRHLVWRGHGGRHASRPVPVRCVRPEERALFAHHAGDRRGARRLASGPPRRGRQARGGGPRAGPANVVLLRPPLQQRGPRHRGGGRAAVAGVARRPTPLDRVSGG